MKMTDYEFDPGNIRFHIRKTHILLHLRNVVFFLLVTLAAAVVAYVFFALVYSTPAERRLKRENRMYDAALPEVQQKQARLSDAIAGLQHKDAEIYSRMFHSEAPLVDPMGSLDFLYASEDLPEEKLEHYTTLKSEELLSKCSAVDSVFVGIFTRLAESDAPLPPMSLPVKNINYLQIGAGVGKRVNPFYKVPVEHTGLDFLVSLGTPVYASASGSVADVFNSKTSGRTVRINHPLGYSTVYANLDEIYVQKGQNVRLGTKIGSAGMSGQSFAPHLHYSVFKDESVREPVNHIFASVSPMEYANMLYMSVNTMQSMD